MNLRNMYLLDPGLLDRGSHSFKLVWEVRRACLAANVPLTVFGFADLDEEICNTLGAHPHFRHSLYASPSSIDEMAEMDHALAMNDSFYDDLERLPLMWRENDQVIIPAISQNQLFGLTTFLNQRRIQPKFVCQLMFNLSWTPWNAPAEYACDLYKLAFGSLGDRGNVVFTAETRALADEFEERFGIPVSTLPIPLGLEPIHDREESDLCPIKLGFFGYSKVEKGFHLLPDAIEHVREADHTARFVVQVMHHGHDQAVIDADLRLRGLDEGVCLVRGVLAKALYDASLRAMDAILVPYDPSSYGQRGSGVLTEAVSLGLPVVACAGTWAATAIERGSAVGVVFQSYSADALAEAIQRLLADFDRYRTTAAEVAKRHGVETTGKAYIERALELSGLVIDDHGAAQEKIDGELLLAGRRLSLSDGPDWTSYVVPAGSGSHAGADGVWVGLDPVKLRFRPEPGPGDLVCQLTLFRPFNLATSTIKVAANGRFVGHHVARGGGESAFSVVIPKDIPTRDSSVELELTCDDALIQPGEQLPRSFRLVAFAYVHAPVLESLPAYRGEAVTFWSGQIWPIIMSDGWSVIENGYVWAIAQDAEIILLPGHELLPLPTLKLTMWAPSPSDMQTVSIAVNGHDLGEAQLDENKEFEFSVPSQALAPGVPLSFRFRASKLIDLSQRTGDQRKLGFALGSFLLAPA